MLLLFLLIVAIGAGDKHAAGAGVRIARFFGGLSFPLYITQNPLVYVYIASVVDRQVPVRVGAPVGAGLVIAAAAIACASLKLYDAPARRWLSQRLLDRRDR